MLVAVCVVVGLFVGSYVGVLADRIPLGLPTATGRSHCDSCGRTLNGSDMIPVLSWVLLRGRCRTCGAKVPARSTVMEIATGALWGAMAWRFGSHWELAGYLVLAAALVALTAIDLRTQKLPREIIYVAAAAGVPWLVVGALVAHEPRRLMWVALGAVGAIAVFLALYFGWRDAMGDGDIRLAGLLAVFLGWIGPMHVPVGLFLGFVLGAVVGVAMMARGKAGRRTAVPFGPFLAAGSEVAILWGHPIIDAWLRR